MSLPTTLKDTMDSLYIKLPGPHRLYQALRHPQRDEILCLEVCGIKFIDSYNFLPFALAKMPATFGLTELKKGYLPHFFNAAENQNYVGPYPAAHYYNPDDMSISNRQAFYTWYEQQKNKTFDFHQEFLDYCISDVDILRRCPVQIYLVCSRPCAAIPGIHYLRQYR
jgi:hypothetical protein